jgi:pimeloyl-ACP methyl ester carboxylesterase
VAPSASRGRRALWIAGVVLLTVLAALVVLPLVWPVPALTDTVEPKTLADRDSRFIDIDRLSVHYKVWGWPQWIERSESGGTVLMPVGEVAILLHGFGASTFSWEPVAARLGQRLPVMAFDRPGYGLTSRPLTWSGPDPYSVDYQADLVVALMDRLGAKKAVLVGHSAGGQVAALVAARFPGRVRALVLEDPAIFAGGPPAFLQPLFRTPQMMRVGPLISRQLGGQAGVDFIRSAWHDPSRIAPATFDGYTKPLKSKDWDAALWLVTVAPRPSDVPGIVSTVRTPTLVLTGDDDRIVPAADSAKTAALIPGARLETIRDCGHLPHEEQPDAFLEAVGAFLDGLPPGP